MSALFARVIALGVALAISGLLVFGVAYPAEAGRPAAEEPGESLPAAKAPYDPRPLHAQVEASTGQDRYRFVVLGDLHVNPRYANRPPQRTIDLVEALHPSFVLTLGDMVDDPHWDLYEADAGAWHRSIPIWPAIGNHEAARGPGVQRWLGFYGLESTYYAFEFRNSRFFALSWNSLGGGSEARRSSEEQLRWLEVELDRTTHPLKWVFLHRPFYYDAHMGNPTAEGGNPIADMVERHGVAAVFGAHIHYYFRTSRQSVAYITASGSRSAGGPVSPDAMSVVLPEDAYAGQRRGASGYVVRRSGQPEDYSRRLGPLVVAVDVEGDTATGRLYTLGRSGAEELDSFSLR